MRLNAPLMINLRFSVMNLVLLFCAFSLLAGGWRMWLGFVLGWTFAVAVDEYLGDTKRVYNKVHELFLSSMLWLTLPLLLLLQAIFYTYLSTGDPFGVVWAAEWLLDSDIGSRRAETPIIFLIGGALTVAMFTGAAGMNVGHELIHRVHSPIDVIIARWMLALNNDSSYLIEHNLGHHRHVGTDRDPDTARRGEYILTFVIRSIIGQLISAFRIEAGRLKNRGYNWWNWRNRAIRGQFISLTYFVLAYYAAGWKGCVVFAVVAFLGKCLLQFTAYIQHYGLVRVIGTKVEPRHSWDTYHILSNTLLYNMPRHSDHHMHAQIPFWHLKPTPGTPQLPYGYKKMILIAFVPFLWRKVVHPLLQDWDENYASEAERRLISERGWDIPTIEREGRPRFMSPYVPKTVPRVAG